MIVVPHLCAPEYKWRVVRFQCLGIHCRILLILNEGKQIFRATLGVEIEEDMAILCQHEYHASEPGWHCHVTFDPADKVPVGVSRSHLKRWPQAEAEHSKMDFAVTEKNALTHAAQRFNLGAPGGLGL